MTPTMAYLLKRMGMDNMLIQRTHYEVKKYLAQSKDLEFLWRQHWGKTLAYLFIFTMPNLGHTIGISPLIHSLFIDFN